MFEDDNRVAEIAQATRVPAGVRVRDAGRSRGHQTYMTPTRTEPIWLAGGGAGSRRRVNRQEIEVGSEEDTRGNSGASESP